MKKLVVVAALVLAPLAVRASELTDKVRIYAPIIALASACDLTVLSATLNEHGAMLKGIKWNTKARKLLASVHWETQVAYIKARDAGDRRGFCKRFIEANREHVRSRATDAERLTLKANNRVRGTVVRDVCGSTNTAAKLSHADRKTYETIRQALQIEAREVAEARGLDVADFLEEVTDRFCEAMAKR